MKIAIDIMGSDLGPAELLQGINHFLDKNQAEIILCGNREEVGEIPSNMQFIHCTQVVNMTDGAMEILRKKDSSMMKAIELVATGEADAVVSCGSTGALLAMATLKIKLIEGVERAGLMTFFPTIIPGKKVAILDIGASNDSTAAHLVDFARIGSKMVAALTNIEIPRTYLLANGSEDEKGSPVSKEAFKILKEQGCPGFLGNLEARDVMSGQADLIVAGGFEGNILLKSAEGTAKTIFKILNEVFHHSLKTKIGGLLVKKELKKRMRDLDYRNTGGALLAGINGIVIKAHGNSNAKSFLSALEITKSLIEGQVLAKL